MTITEGEWSEVDRAEMFALEEFRTAILCPCGCGFHAADTLGNEKLGTAAQFSADRVVCLARLARLEAESAVDATRDPKRPPPVSVGARVWTTRMIKKAPQPGEG